MRALIGAAMGVALALGIASGALAAEEAPAHYSVVIQATRGDKLMLETSLELTDTPGMDAVMLGSSQEAGTMPDNLAAVIPPQGWGEEGFAPALKEPLGAMLPPPLETAHACGWHFCFYVPNAEYVSITVERLAESAGGENELVCSLKLANRFVDETRSQ